MGFFKKNEKADPISNRAALLNQQIADLEAQIQRLNRKESNEPARRGPQSGTSGAVPAPQAPPHPAAPPSGDPIFEEVKQQRIKAPPDAISTPQHFNDLGIRKYDLLALIKRWFGLFRAPPPKNSVLVNYLAAGSIQGLRPMRYEKRVARNRFIVLAIVFLAALWGILVMLFKNH